MIKRLRSERFAAFFLLSAAIFALVLANSAWGEQLLAAKSSHFEIAFLGLDLSLGHWVSDGLLVIFFFTAAVELRYELSRGSLNTPQKALRPTIAALGGVIVPAVMVYCFTIGTELTRGWPIVTATDIAFALGALALFGKYIPSRVRVFLLALAILDDIIGILIIAVFFADSPDLLQLLLGISAVAIFGLLSRLLSGKYRVIVALLMLVFAGLAWYFILLSGVHATIAGVLLGLIMSSKPALATRHRLEPWVNGLVLPIFAFTTSLVVIPKLQLSELSIIFWAVGISLPIGKLIGIVLAGNLAMRLGTRHEDSHMNFPMLLAAGSLGGIGFTVSLLMNELAFASDAIIRDQGTLAVLLGSGISIVLSGITVFSLSNIYRRRFEKSQGNKIVSTAE